MKVHKCSTYDKKRQVLFYHFSTVLTRKHHHSKFLIEIYHNSFAWNSGRKVVNPNVASPGHFKKNYLNYAGHMIYHSCF